MRYTTVGEPRSRKRDIIVAVSLAAVSIVFQAGLDTAGEMTVVRGLRATVLRPFLATHEVFAARAGLAERVERLSARNDSLARRILGSAGLADENRQLRALLELPDRDAGDYFAAELVPGRDPAGRPSGFQLRARTAIEPPLAVATPDGLLGVVRNARGRVGLGDYWTHPDFRVAVITADGRTSGIVRPFVDENGDQLMLLQGVPFQAEVPPETRLVTSGRGGIYPRGLPVGRVLVEHEQQLGWTHSFLVEPSVRPGEETLVVAWRPGALADPSVPAAAAADSDGSEAAASDPAP